MRKHLESVKTYSEFTFDTNAFNKLLDDDSLSVPTLKLKAKIYASHIQIEELNATQTEARRNALLSIFHEVTYAVVRTKNMVFPIKFEGMEFGDEVYELLCNELDSETRNLPKKKQKTKLKNNRNDALIGEIAIKNGFTLVTDDPELTLVVRKKYSHVVNYQEFKELISVWHVCE